MEHGKLQARALLEHILSSENQNVQCAQLGSSAQAQQLHHRGVVLTRALMQVPPPVNSVSMASTAHGMVSLHLARLEIFAIPPALKEFQDSAVLVTIVTVYLRQLAQVARTQ